MSGKDPVFETWLDSQLRDARSLESQSELLGVHPVGPGPARNFVVELRSRGLVRPDPTSEPRIAEQFLVGITFPRTWLRRASLGAVTILTPHVFHPNVRGAAICLGALRPGTSLPWLIHHVHQILTWQNRTIDERNALNPAACRWARDPRNRDKTPLDRRPLTGRRVLPPHAPRERT